MTRGTVDMEKGTGHEFPEEVRRQSTEALKRLRQADLSHPIDVYVDGAGDVSQQTPVILPPQVLELLVDVLSKVAADQPVSIVTPDAIFTTQQAADMLNVSRPYVVKLIDNGDLPAEKVGRHRRIRASDLEEFRQRQQMEARRAAREMTRLAGAWEDDD